MKHEYEHRDRQDPESSPKQRKRRGKLISVDGWSRKERPGRAELDPEGTVSTDQTITEIGLHSADSDTNEYIERSHVKAADAVECILTAVPPTQRDVLVRVLPVLEPHDSLNAVSRKIGVAPAQISRAYEAARKADKRRIFKEAKHERRSPVIAHTKYQPVGVSMECYMMPHQGPVMFSIGSDERTSIGVDLVNSPDRSHFDEASGSTRPTNPQQENAEVEAPAAVTPSPQSGVCQHPERQWLRAGFADLRLTCRCCRAELARKNPFMHQP